jgi:hypothetical protein
MRIATRDEERQSLANFYTGQSCVLVIDGTIYESTVRGRLNQFATVSPLNPSIPGVEFNWWTVQRIMSNDKVFRA